MQTNEVLQTEKHSMILKEQQRRIEANAKVRKYIILSSAVIFWVAILGTSAFLIFWLATGNNTLTETLAIVITLPVLALLALSLPLIIYKKDTKQIDKIFAEYKSNKNGKLNVGQINEDVFKFELRVKLLNEYYSDAKKQVRTAFLFALGMCIAGFALLAATVILATQDIETVAVIVTAVGGGVTQFIAGTALYLYHKVALNQKYYHSALRENERNFLAIDIAKKMSTPAATDKMLEKIIKEILEFATEPLNDN